MDQQFVRHRTVFPLYSHPRGINYKEESAANQYMERLVYLNQATGAEEFLERAIWSSVDGVEVDITDMSEDEYLTVQELLVNSPLATRSLHYERTNTISLKEWDLFESQLEMLIERAKKLGCGIVSVHPPKVERDTANTLKDLEAFVEQVDAFASTSNVRICFELTGFMKDPQMMNIAFANLDSPSLGVMIDLESLVDGVDPLFILQKLDVDIHKIRMPLTVDRIEEHIDVEQEDMAVVATSLE